MNKKNRLDKSFETRRKLESLLSRNDGLDREIQENVGMAFLFHKKISSRVVSSLYATIKEKTFLGKQAVDKIR